MNWIPLVATSLLTPLLTGVVVYLLQLRWQERMEKRLTRFSKLHERQAEVIARLYGLLVEVQSDLSSCAYAVSDTAEDFTREKLEERLDATEQSTEAFWNYFERHQIYLPQSLTERIGRLYRDSLRVYATGRQIEISQALMESSDNYSDREQYNQYLEELPRIVEEEIAPLKEDIEREFRRLLGS
jgi:pyrroloquinoline quinone (PQQ) biosynthesis protein C